MKRREFVRNMLAAAPLLAVPSAFFSSCRKKEIEPNGYRVLVAGAGIAGLSAAKALVAEGFEVIVIEGRDRVGGRIFTDRSQGFPIDLGAS